MTAIDFIVKGTQLAGEKFFTAAKKVPSEKLEWKPLDQGRSVLDLAQEIGQCPLWAEEILTHGEFRGTHEEADREYIEALLKTPDLKSCEAAFATNFEKFAIAAMEFPESKLFETVKIPWGEFKYIEMLSLALWNCQYHEGQVNYIQTLYGDRDS